MKYVIFAISIFFTFYLNGQTTYKTASGIEFKVGDTIKIGSPLSNLGWVSIFKDKNRKKYAMNKNFIGKEVIIKSIDTTELPVSFSFDVFRTTFYVNIDEALANKELIPSIKMELTNKQLYGKYELLQKLKDLFDNGTITKEEFNAEKKKILNSNEK
jgi:hypothetical protein